MAKSDVTTAVDGQHDSAGKSAVDKHCPAWHAIGQGDCRSCANGRDAGVKDVIAELLGGGLNSQLAEDCSVEVAKTVARELAEDTHHQHLGRTPACFVGLVETAEVPPGNLLIIELLTDALLDLLNLQQNQARVAVAVSVVLDQEINGLFLLAVGKEIPRRLGDEVNRTEHYEACETLADKRYPPRPVALDVLAPESNTSRGDRAAEPTTVVEARATTTPLRRSDFHRVRGGCNSHELDAGTEHQTADSDLGQAEGTRSDDTTDNDAKTTPDHADTTTPFVTDGGSERGGNNRATRGFNRSLAVDQLAG